MSAIESPCISVCKLNDGKTLCVGCFRSREEIGEWRMADDQRKLEILASAAKRQNTEYGKKSIGSS